MIAFFKKKNKKKLLCVWVDATVLLWGSPSNKAGLNLVTVLHQLNLPDAVILGL